MKKIFIITGEYSGDIHAANVVRELFKIDNDLTIEGVGGENLKNAGVKLFCDHSKMSAVGLNFSIIFEHIMLGKKIVDYLEKSFQPDLVIMVDYGGFNLSVAKI